MGKRDLQSSGVEKRSSSFVEEKKGGKGNTEGIEKIKKTKS